MSILSDTVRGVGRLLFPVRCPVCGGEMPPGSRVVCTRCRYAVPLTGFCYATYNPLWERLSALVPVEQASAFLYFIPGSGWRELIHRFKYDGAWRLARDMGVWYGHCLADSGLYDTVDRIVPVPLHWRKRLRRGYNQAEYLAEGIARALRAEVDRHSVRRIRNNPGASAPPPRRAVGQRRGNLRRTPSRKARGAPSPAGGRRAHYGRHTALMRRDDPARRARLPAERRGAGRPAAGVRPRRMTGGKMYRQTPCERCRCGPLGRRRRSRTSRERVAGRRAGR